MTSSSTGGRKPESHLSQSQKEARSGSFGEPIGWFSQALSRDREDPAGCKQLGTKKAAHSCLELQTQVSPSIKPQENTMQGLRGQRSRAADPKALPKTGGKQPWAAKPHGETRRSAQPLQLVPAVLRATCFPEHGCSEMMCPSPGHERVDSVKITGSRRWDWAARGFPGAPQMGLASGRQDAY